MDVATSYSTQVKAADYARVHLTGKRYNNNFAWNKGSNIDTLNCSELVYKAYKRSVNIDLDFDGGLGVYPVDIRLFATKLGLGVGVLGDTPGLS